MFIQRFTNNIRKHYDLNEFFGVPDSLLKHFAWEISQTLPNNNTTAINEGNAVALAAGHYLSTGEIPCVYLQNSGLGNIVNPVSSLTNEYVYGIPIVYVIGWRGDPDVQDEPQHEFQGRKTTELLDTLEIEYFVIETNTTVEDLKNVSKDFKEKLSSGKSVAFLVKKNALESDEKATFSNSHQLKREEVIDTITNHSHEDIIVSTTGKTSRELFEIREKNNQSHKYDFLTVGSMGHSSSIALSIAKNKPKTNVWCLDGDGAALMHMGSLAMIGSSKLSNYIHVVINNEAHESVGGNPTVAGHIDFIELAHSIGYAHAFSVDEASELEQILEKINTLNGPIMIEIKCAIGSRSDLGRPTSTPKENRDLFMSYLKGLK